MKNAHHIDDGQRLRDQRDELLRQLKGYTPAAFYAAVRGVAGGNPAHHETQALRGLWFGGWDDDNDDPINLARALTGHGLRLRDAALDEDAVGELSALLRALEAEFSAILGGLE